MYLLNEGSLAEAKQACNHVNYQPTLWLNS